MSCNDLHLLRPKASRRATRIRNFWARVTEGLPLRRSSGSQFVSDAKASYALYSKDVDWEKVGRGARGPRRILAVSLGAFSRPC